MRFVGPQKNAGKVEFVSIIAMMMAIVAFSTDIMLPVLPLMASDLGLTEVQDMSGVIIAFILGLGFGTFIAGPISDAVGRRLTVFCGLGIFCVATCVAWQAPSAEWLYVARFLQGIGAAGPRVAGQAIVRDRYSGAEMAQIMSFAMMLFLIAPAVAPMLGDITARLISWRAIFVLLLVFAVTLLVWFGTRQGETLPVADRKRLRLRDLLASLFEILKNRTVVLSMTIQTALMCTLFSAITMVQPIFEQTYDRNDSFPYWFAALASVSAISSFLNATIVRRYGMHRLVSVAVGLQIVVSFLVLSLLLSDIPGSFWIFLLWLFGVLTQTGMTTANLHSIAMEPMGHIAGATASVVGSVSMIGGACLAWVFSATFNGTAVPLVAVALAMSCIARALMFALDREKPIPV